MVCRVVWCGEGVRAWCDWRVCGWLVSDQGCGSVYRDMGEGAPDIPTHSQVPRCLPCEECRQGAGQRLKWRCAREPPKCLELWLLFVVSLFVWFGGRLV